MRNVKWQNSKCIHTQPEPIISYQEQPAHDVNNTDNRKAITDMIEEEGSKGKCLQSICLFLIGNIQYLL